MVELRALGEDTFARSFAGDAYNTAVYLKRSLPAAQVQFLTASGDDEMSEAMRRTWRAQEIDDALAFRVQGGSAGLYLIETDAFGERSFRYWRSNSAAKHWLALLLERGESVLRGADIVYYSGISLAILDPDEREPAIELLRRTRSHVGSIAFDPNVRLRLWQSSQGAAHIIRAAISACDIALPSAEDLTWLLGVSKSQRQIEMLIDMGVPEVALTLGSKGCAIATEGRCAQFAGQSALSPIDTSGAGDAFNGVYLANRLRGISPDMAAQAALEVASRVVTHAGAIVPVSVSHPEGSQIMCAGEPNEY
jgi:2-dehydro-3-deoxygluconokinase